MIVAKALSVRLGGRDVLKDVTFDAAAGELHVLVGPNGAGKSTLLRCLAGLARPSAGAAELSGVSTIALDARDRARRLAFLPQASEAHWPVSVMELALLGRLPYRQGVAAGFADEDRAAAAAALERLAIAHLRDRTVTELSGGERRLALLARAVAGAPTAILADEPATGLDPGRQIDVMTALSCLARDGAAVVAVAHELTLAGRFAHRLTLLHEGRVVASGAPDEVLTSHNLARCYGVREARADVFSIGPLERLDDRAGVGQGGA